MHVCKRLVLIWLLMVLCDARIIGRTRRSDSNSDSTSNEANTNDKPGHTTVCDKPRSSYPEQDSFLAMITNVRICDHFDASESHLKIHFHPSVQGCLKALKWLEEEFNSSSTFPASTTNLYDKIICNRVECKNETPSKLCARNSFNTRFFSHKCEQCAVGCKAVVTGRTRYVTVKDKTECKSTPAVNGSWTDWSNWGECSVTCGGGVQTRTRNCTNPAPKHGGEYCVGNSSEVRTCEEDSCPIDGGWTDWISWGQCSVTCGGGVQTRTRNCTNPAPEHGGDDCVGNESEERTCEEGSCPIDGGWTDWISWGLCSVTCGGGSQTRTRYCTNPEPQHGGERCVGTVLEKRTCEEDSCPIHGGWTDWSNWGQCSVTCEGGNQTRTRNCTNPAPQHGGDYCVGNSSEERNCNEFSCPKLVEPIQIETPCIIKGHGNLSCGCPDLSSLSIPEWPLDETDWNRISVT